MLVVIAFGKAQLLKNAFKEFVVVALKAKQRVRALLPFFVCDEHAFFVYYLAKLAITGAHPKGTFQQRGGGGRALAHELAPERFFFSRQVMRRLRSQPGELPVSSADYWRPSSGELGICGLVVTLGLFTDFDFSTFSKNQLRRARAGGRDLLFANAPLALAFLRKG
jgi:hypothetical protein